MRSLLLAGLTAHMQGLPESHAAQLAHDLTTLVSAHVGGLSAPPSSNAPLLRRLPCFPRETWSVHTLSVPWEAFDVAHREGTSTYAVSKVKALCSSPAEMDPVFSRQAADSSLWGGSLLSELAMLMQGANEDLIVVAPYWRADGVRSLLTTTGRSSYSGLSARLFTVPAEHMRPEDQQALLLFASSLMTFGAKVRILAPKAIAGKVPFLHAKLLIADARKAYVGSANFTGSGFDRGIESGVLVEGSTASAFARWADALEGGCQDWQASCQF